MHGQRNIRIYEYTFSSFLVT